jgi:hypothetical protein
MDLATSDAWSFMEVEVDAGVDPGYEHAEDGDSDPGSGTPESAYSDCWLTNGVSLSHEGCTSVCSGWQESTNGQHASNAVTAVAETGMLMGTYCPNTAGAWAKALCFFGGLAEATYEFGEYSGPNETWVEGQIDFWQFRYDLADVDAGDWNLLGYVIVGETELGYSIDPDGNIHVTGWRVDLEDVIQVNTTFYATGGVAAGTIYFREYVEPETTIAISSSQNTLANYAEVISNQNSCGHIGFSVNTPARYGASISCEALTGTPD